jgi:hypothetical protein
MHYIAQRAQCSLFFIVFPRGRSPRGRDAAHWKFQIYTLAEPQLAGIISLDDLSAIFLYYTSKICKKDRQGIEIITQLPLLTNVIDLPNKPVF